MASCSIAAEVGGDNAALLPSTEGADPAASGALMGMPSSSGCSPAAASCHQCSNDQPPRQDLLWPDTGSSTVPLQMTFDTTHLLLIASNASGM